MATDAGAPAGTRRGGSGSRDFWVFLGGQTLSDCGNALTAFVLPLLVFDLTRSAVAVGLATAAFYAPYLLVGLVMGAWVDRTDRRRLMIRVDLARAVTVATVPLAAVLGVLSPWWIYAVVVVTSTLGIAFNAGAFAAVPFLEPDPDRLVLANSRLQAASSAAWLLGPLVGGVVLMWTSAQALVLTDALTFAVSAASLAAVRTAFQASVAVRTAGSLLAEAVDGLRYVLGHPFLRALALMAALMNLFLSNTIAQIVVLARERMAATPSQVAWFYAAASGAVLVFSLATPLLRAHLSTPQLLAGATLANGVFTLWLAETRSLWAGLVAYGVVMGTTMFFRIVTSTLRQGIAPSELLGRTIAVATVLAWSTQPVGAVVGGVAIDHVGVAWAYTVGGVALIAIGVIFGLGPLRRVQAARADVESERPLGRSRRRWSTIRAGQS